MMLNPNTSCYCFSGLPYAQCCQPVHLKPHNITDASLLMKARFSALRLGNIAFMVQTTLPSQRDMQLSVDLTLWSKTIDWLSLNVIHHTRITPTHQYVTFLATFKEKTQTHKTIGSHSEQSLFVQCRDVWYFVRPDTVKPAPKASCWCDSGQAFAQCCGLYVQNH